MSQSAIRYAQRTRYISKEMFNILLDETFEQCDESLKDEIFKWIEILRD